MYVCVCVKVGCRTKMGVSQRDPVALLACSLDPLCPCFIPRAAAAKVQICCSSGDWRAEG